MVVIPAILLICGALYFLTLLLGKYRKSNLYVGGVAALALIVGFLHQDASTVWFEIALILAVSMLGYSIVDHFKAHQNLISLLGSGLLLEVSRHLNLFSLLDYTFILTTRFSLPFSILEAITLSTLYSCGVRAHFGIPILIISTGSLLLTSVLQRIINVPVSVLYILALIFLVENLISIKTVNQNG